MRQVTQQKAKSNPVAKHSTVPVIPEAAAKSANASKQTTTLKMDMKDQAFVSRGRHVLSSHLLANMCTKLVAMV